MQISVSGRHLHLPQTVQDYARSKASRLTHFFNRIQTVDVVIAKQGINYMVETIVKPDHHQSFIGHGSGPDVQVCIDLSLDKLENWERGLWKDQDFCIPWGQPFTVVSYDEGESVELKVNPNYCLRDNG